jgi:hypothetical protein
LGELNFHQPLNRLLGVADIDSQNLGCLRLVDSIRERLRM